MLTPEQIEYQQELLVTHRRFLALLLKRQALQVAAEVSPSVVIEIGERRAAIRQIKAALRSSEVTVDDELNDEPLPVGDVPVEALPHVSEGRPSTPTVQVGGDQVGGDKIGGDKVGRDKITDNRTGIFWDRARIPLLVVIVIIIIWLATSIITAGANVGGFRSTLQGWGVLAEPMLFPVEQPNETLIIVVPFFRPAGVMDNDEAHTIQREISEEGRAKNVSNLRVEIVDGKAIRAEDRATVTELAERYHASMVIWGSNTGVEVTVNYLNLRQPDFAAAAVSLQETGESGRTQLANPQAYAGFITQDLPSTMTFLSLFAVGQSAYSRADYVTATSIISGALDTLNGLPRLPQGTSEAYLHLGWLHQTQGDNERAKTAYDRTITLNPKDADAYYNRGILYKEQGKVEQALADYNQAITLNPKDADAYYNRGILYKEQGKVEQALADYNQVITLNPKAAVAYYNRGILYQEQGKVEQALADYNQAITHNPQYANAYINRGLIYQKRGERDTAIADFQQTRDLSQDEQLKQKAIDRLKELGAS